MSVKKTPAAQITTGVCKQELMKMYQITFFFFFEHLYIFS